MSETSKRWVWLKDFCAQYDIPDKTVRRMIAEGKIGHIRVGTKIAFLPSHIDEYIQRNERPATVRSTSTLDLVSAMASRLQSV